MSPINHLKRSQPFFLALTQRGMKPLEKLTLLKKYPDFVLKDMVEILHNIVNDNCKLSSHYKCKLRKMQKPIEQILNAVENKRDVRKTIYKQKGEFLSLIMPIISSLLTSLLHG